MIGLQALSADGEYPFKVMAQLPGVNRFCLAIRSWVSENSPSLLIWRRTNFLVADLYSVLAWSKHNYWRLQYCAAGPQAVRWDHRWVLGSCESWYGKHRDAIKVRRRRMIYLFSYWLLYLKPLEVDS